MSGWLRDAFHDFKRRERPNRPFKPEDLDHKLEHVARYVAFLNIVHRLVQPPPVRLVDTVSDDPLAKPVQVDLVFDIGNSRTCGILIESFPNESRVALGNSLVLQLRDLSRPDTTYSEPFDSHVELSQRWTATPLYKLTLGPGGNRPRLPITVTLQRGAPDEDVDFEEADRFHLGEARKEEIKIVDAYDRDGAPMTRLMQLSLDTMAADDGYWLDTGILTIG